MALSSKLRRFFALLWSGLTILRLVVANLIFIGVLLLVGVALFGRPALEPFPERAVLILDPVGQVVDVPSPVDPLALLGGRSAASNEVPLRDLVEVLEFAADDDRIEAVVLELDEVLGLGLSRVQELLPAIDRVRDAGKRLVATGDYYSQQQYALAAQADTVLLHPYGAVALEGYSAYYNYFREALDKASVKVHVFQGGDYKSISELFRRDSMSDGEREITQRWLAELWGQYTAMVERGRAMEPGSVDTLLTGFADAVERQGGDVARLALEQGLVDALSDRAETREMIAGLVDADADALESVALPYRQYLKRRRREDGEARRAPTVAVVRAEGNITLGQGLEGEIGGDGLVALIRDTVQRREPDALVLRITSGGGAMLPSEFIRAELARIRDTGIPVVVSMGPIAASGGYYIATAADHIVATPATVTGSIGVFLALPTVDGLLDRAGVGTDGVGTTPLAGAYRLDRPLQPPLERVLGASVKDSYARFRGHVARARGLTGDALDAATEGRVWSAPELLRRLQLIHD